MRALRVPRPTELPDAGAAVPVWIIDGQGRGEGERREAPRLEVPRDDSPPPRVEESTAPALPPPGATLIVIPL